MLTICRNIYKSFPSKFNFRYISTTSCISKTLKINEKCMAVRQNNVFVPINSYFDKEQFFNMYLHIEIKRYFSKKKGSKRNIQVEEESDDEDESDETYEDSLNENIVTRTVPSMRLDSVIKAGLSITKKRIEKEFYADKIRINGEKVLKKASTVSSGDEIDLIKGYSPENQKFLLVDRLIIRAVDKISGTGMYPVKMEIFKGLTIENYEQQWNLSSVEDMD